MKNSFKNYTGHDLGQDFKNFYNKEKSRIKKAITVLGCTDFVMSRQFYYYYGYFKSATGQCYYFGCSDVRHFPHDKLLYRRANDYYDYGGSSNQYVDINKLNKMELI